ncbi:MAG TPA: hypothetical protein VIQ78_02705 [Terrimesophilobacter sp.]|jgi:hypothetical protein|uniref:hypothetical protein n=1 Tax=Terrimesophilobacter sp. TaxID=2906435 RepID=UPI002F94855D
MRQDPTERVTGQRTALRRVAQPWTLILVATGLFQVLRGAPIDGAIFLVVATVLMMDALGWVSGPNRAQLRHGVLIGAAAVLGTLMVIVPRHGIIEGVILSAIGLSVLFFAWPTPGDTDAALAPLRRSAVLWSVIGVVCCLWEVSSFLLGLPSADAKVTHPSISLLLDPVLDTPEGRVGFTALWLLSGIALLRRGRAR